MKRETLNDDVKRLLLDNGADLVGFADLREKDLGLPRGVALAVAVDPDVLRSIHDGPNRAYFNEYHRINRMLDKLAMIGAEYLKSRGCVARAQTTTIVDQSADYSTPLPHKTVATRAGLGWIGKSALLVTKEFGSGLRLSSIVTDAPLTCGEPVNESGCGTCAECVKNCPAQAVKGGNWSLGTKREEIFDAYKCRETARRLCLENFGEEITICGKCIVSCPHTQKYLERS